MKQWGLLVLVALMSATPAVGDGSFAGTRPGISDEPLTSTGTLVLLDVSKIDGAEQSFTADVAVAFPVGLRGAHRGVVLDHVIPATPRHARQNPGGRGSTRY